MTSSTLAGERRWGSARRGGMTVLGKVAVPKPINLPSQRLENHGLDPNVEIVPKGSLSWGSRSSSSTTNAWGSSSLSPRADGSASSPSHLSGRPSSGGSGTRPSTAGSERVTEPAGSAWGPNSRPSSASGLLPSNQSSLTPLRPRSAETRPGSSQLSRFAEPVSDSPGAWGASDTTERLGVISSKKDDFSLSSGDFPTLGADKDHPGKNTGSHSRPSSASGRVAQTKDMAVTSHADDTSGAANATRKDASQNVDDGGQPGMERWQGEPQQYFNPNVPPQNFDAWRGPPMNGPAGIWYRGPPGGPPYGAPVGPGGFPMEPYPYFHPQIPPPAFANSQPVPAPRAGPRGHHPKNGNGYRPQMPDPYVRPNMPFRPGFYPPRMGFEGYYGPPMGYCNSTERDMPFMGMGPGPSVYDRCPPPNAPDLGDSHPRAGRPSPATRITTDEVDPVHSSDVRGPYKVLRKQSNQWDGKEHGENRGHMPSANESRPSKDGKTEIVQKKYEWGAEEDEVEEDMDSFSHGVSSTTQAKSSQISGSAKPADDFWLKKSASISSSSAIAQVSSSNEREPALLSTKNDATLIQKIEGLNAKARAADGRIDNISSVEEQIPYSTTTRDRLDASTNKGGKSVGLLEGPGYSNASSHGVAVSADRMSQPAVVMSRKPYHGTSSGTDYQGKRGKFGNEDPDGWKKPGAVEVPGGVSASRTESAYDVPERHPHRAVEASGDNLLANDDKELVGELQDSTDNQAQRAKMRELAKQRAIQLQKEEEERTREQKAKALAKLEELNRRMQSSDASSQTTTRALPHRTSDKDQEGKSLDLDTATKPGASIPASPLKTEVVAQVNENTANEVVGSRLPQDLSAENSKTMKSEPVPHNESVPPKQDVSGGATDGEIVPQLGEDAGVRPRRMNYKQKQNAVVHKNLNENAIPDIASEGQKSPVDISAADGASNLVASSEVGARNQPRLPDNSLIVSESSAPQRRRISRSNKNKNKQEDLPVPNRIAVTSTETVPQISFDENVRSQASTLELQFGSISTVVNSEKGVEILEQQPSLPVAEAPGRVNQWKPQHPRRMPKNQQANRFADRSHGNDSVKWAPVRTQTKADNNAETTVEGEEKSRSESVSSAKYDNLVPNSSKNKRAEMERYVPKPVAKELAQQFGMQNSDSSFVNTSTHDHVESQLPASLSTGNIPSTVQSRDGVSRHNKHGKVQGAWRQRSSTDSPVVKNEQQGLSSASELHRSSQGAIMKSQPLKPATDSAQAEKNSSELNASEAHVTSSNPDVSGSETFPVSKDQAVTGRGSRQTYRGHRNTGNSRNNENRNISSSETERTHIQLASDMNQQEGLMVSKETRPSGERLSSQWLPKSQANSVSKKGTKATGSQNIGAEPNRVIRKDYPQHQRVKSPPQHVREHKEIDAVLLDQSVSENKVVVEVQKVENHEPRRERRTSSSKGRPYSPKQNHMAAEQSEPVVSTDTQHERPFSAGSRRYGNQNSRSGRGNESRGEYWSAQDNRQHNRDRQRHNTHYEYQPVGSYNNPNSSNFELQADGSRNLAAPRYRERGQSHPKRGGDNFHGRQSVRNQVDTGCD